METYITPDFGGRRYHALDLFLKNKFGHKVYKLSLNAGLTCPNRDGTIDTRGCIFCSAGGSGDFAQSPALSITGQIESAKALVSNKITDGRYIAYFQAYTNTYGPVDYLRKIYLEAVENDDIAAISIATRPDCLSDEILLLLDEINHIKPVFIELGLQTIHERSATFIRRGYRLSVYDDAVKKLNKLGILSVVHIILGLPGETVEDMLATVDYVVKSGIHGIKLQLLHVLKGTDLYDYYIKHSAEFHLMNSADYTDCVICALERIPPDIVIHRLTGDGPKKILEAPLWSADKKRVLNTITHELKERNTFQGRNIRHVTGNTDAV